MYANHFGSERFGLCHKTAGKQAQPRALAAQRRYGTMRTESVPLIYLPLNVFAFS
jgi:hypothetical protein